MPRSGSRHVVTLAMITALIKRWRGAGAWSSTSSSASGGLRSSAASAFSPSDAANPTSADSATRRTFQLVPFGAKAPAGVTTISCDGLVTGASLDVTHWTNNRTPEELYADTSTEIAINLAKANDETYAHLVNAVVLNNHYDTDGALSVFACLHPSLALQHAALLISGAEAGDFGEWSSDDGVKLDCALMSLKDSCDNEEEAYDRALELLPDLLKDIGNQGGGGYESLWRAGYDEAMEGYQDLQEGRAVLSRGSGKMAILNERLGSQRLSPYALHRGLVESDLWHGTNRILRVEHRPGDNKYRYEYENVGHGWVTKLKQRKVVPGGDGAHLAKEMGAGWSKGGHSDFVSICQSSYIDTIPEEVSDRLWKLDPVCQ
jgi:hypothetical protein